MATAWQPTRLIGRRRLGRRPVSDPEGPARTGPRPLIGGWLRASGRGLQCVFLGLAAAGAILAEPWSGCAAGQAGPADDAPGIGAAPSAEVAFDAPRRFVALIDRSTERQRLYGTGDIIPEPRGPGGAYQVKQIEQGRLQLRSLRGGKATWIAVGGVIPGQAGWRVIGTPSLRMVEYRFVPTGGPLDAEPRVVELRDDRARLQVDIPLAASASPATGTAARATAMPAPSAPEAAREFENTLLGRVRVTPTSDDSYEINATDLNGALEQRGRLWAEVWPRVWPSVSWRSGVQINIQSPIADGTLSPRGFRVWIPNLAQRAGIQLGDLIVGVNGQPINGIADAYRVYRQMERDPNLSVIQLDLVRDGQPLTRTYRIR